jgi:Fe-S cluster biogenesis protein NfuA
MADGAALVVEHFDEIVKPDGGTVRLLGREGDTLRVGYRAGVNEECETCVISADQLSEMMRDLLRDHDPGIEQVRVEELTE